MGSQGGEAGTAEEEAASSPGWPGQRQGPAHQHRPPPVTWPQLRAGDMSHNLLWRLRHGSGPAGLSTRIVATLIGSNDIAQLCGVYEVKLPFKTDCL